MFQGNFSKGVVKQLGFATACALVMYQIIQDTKKIGSFVMMISYFFSVQCMSTHRLFSVEDTC